MWAVPARAEGGVFLDSRGDGRAMRLTWHHECDLVVLSLWRDQTCAGSFRLARQDVSAFVDALVDGLRDASGLQLAGRSAAPQARAPQPGPPAPGQTVYRDPVSPAPAEHPASFMDWVFGGPSNSHAS